jgi:hypothetical protein
MAVAAIAVRGSSIDPLPIGNPPPCVVTRAIFEYFRRVAMSGGASTM